MWLHRIAHSVDLRVRRLLGRGFGRRYFERFYAVQGNDAWDFDRNPYNQERFRFIVDSIPGGRADRVLELGCAEGQMTLHIAPRAGSVVAVDIAEEAVRRARSNCAGLSNVEFVAADVRDGLPPGTFDAVICSDVLYYLSPSELSALLRALARSLRSEGVLVAAETSTGSAKLPSRLEDIVAFCGQRVEWTLLGERALPLQSIAGDVRVAVFRRTFRVEPRPPA